MLVTVSKFTQCGVDLCDALDQAAIHVTCALYQQSVDQCARHARILAYARVLRHATISGVPQDQLRRTES